MKIAIQAADLDCERIDGTRVYIKNLLNRFGQLSPGDDFLVIHKNGFNPELAPNTFPNYRFIQKSAKFFWTQTVLARKLQEERPDVLWMPMAALPLWRPRGMRTVVTIHDLAFKIFPETFTWKDRLKLNLAADYSIRKAERIIAISEATKKDILRFYPETDPGKIRVIQHGFSDDIFSVRRDREQESFLMQKLGIGGEYILYSGALQPRKNIVRLVTAFNEYKERSGSNIKLVLSGEAAWLEGEIVKAVKNSPFQKDIIMPGRVSFSEVGDLFRGASLFIYPSLYEGFGITVLEAFAAGVPLITANNSSLPEVAGDAALYFDADNSQQLSEQIEKILSSRELQLEMITKGRERLANFSWEKCAEETLRYICE